MNEASHLGFLFYSVIEHFHLNFYEIPLKYCIEPSKNKFSSYIQIKTVHNGHRKPIPRG